MSILEWIETAQEYEPLIKTGVAALGTYASYKDQKKKNQMQQQAYDDYMRQVDAAGQEARAAIDINYTPMVVSGVPQTKADVTDFTAVAARGGLMNLPNRQRKRYYSGTGEEDIEVMDIDITEPTTSDLEKETGLNLSGEQVFHDSGDDRTNAQNVWSSGAIDQEIYEMNFEIFFQSGDWMDHISQAPAATGDMQMASHEGNDAFLENRYQELLELNLSPAEAAAQAQKELSSGDVPGPMATGGIAGLRHGGRPGYNIGEIVTADTEGIISEVSPSQTQQIEQARLYQEAEDKIMQKFYETFPGVDDPATIQDAIADLQAQGVSEHATDILSFAAGLDMITPQSIEKSAQRISMGDTQYGDEIRDEFFAQGGRIGYDAGGNYESKIKELMDKGLSRELAEALVISELSPDAYTIIPEDKAQGGRIGYAFGPGPVEEVVTDSMTEIEGQTAGGGDRGWRAQMLAEDLAQETIRKRIL